MTLFDAQVNKTYIVKRVTAQNNACRRLTDMGFTRGSFVRLLGSAPFKGAVLAELRGTLIALRKDAAEAVEIEPAQPVGLDKQTPASLKNDKLTNNSASNISTKHVDKFNIKNASTFHAIGVGNPTVTNVKAFKTDEAGAAQHGV